MGTDVKIAPSILSADFARLGEEVAAVSAAGADYIHVDVMDGHFVPNLTIGPDVVKAIRPHTERVLDVHLMIAPAEPYIEEFAKAGADIITVHQEATEDLPGLVQKIKAAGVKAGVSIKPNTLPEVLDEILPELDLVLIMSVEPGFGGQSFMPNSLEKLRYFRSKIDALGKAVDLEVDGGINSETASQVIEAGADVLVAGSAVFKGDAAEYAANIEALRG